MSSKQFHRVVNGADTSRLFYAKLVGRTNAAGTELTTATMQAVSASNFIEFLLNGVGDGDINDYTAAGGAAGRILITDANANTVGEVIDIINGIGAGQDGGFSAGGSRRWRANLADFPRSYVLTALDLLNQAATVDLMLGERHVGASVFADTSALADITDHWVGIGTEGGTLKGSGLTVPDYFEDLPGESRITGNAGNTPDRTRQVAKQNDEGVSAARYRVVIEAIRFSLDFATTKVISIFREDAVVATDTPAYQEAVAVGSLGSAVLTGAAGAFVFKGDPGYRYFVRVNGTGAITEGHVTVVGRYELAG